MSKRMIAVSGLVVLALSAAPSFAGRGGGPPGPPPMMGPPMGPGRMMFGDTPAMMLPLVLRHADLTPEQHNQVRQIMDTDRDRLRTLFKQLQTANDQLADKLFAPGTVQASDLAPQVQQITQLRQQLMEQGLKSALAIRALLTPEQLAKVTQLKDRLEKLHQEMHGILEGDE